MEIQKLIYVLHLSIIIGFTINGNIVKSNSALQKPSGVIFIWRNVIEGDDIKDGESWNWIGGESTITNNDFSLSMGINIYEFDQNLTLHSSIVERLNAQIPEFDVECKCNKFAMGFIMGYYGDTYDYIKLNNIDDIKGKLDFSKGCFLVTKFFIQKYFDQENFYIDQEGLIFLGIFPVKKCISIRKKIINLWGTCCSNFSLNSKKHNLKNLLRNAA